MKDKSTIAISIGDAPDRLRLGFPAREVDRVLFLLCTALIRNGYSILYGGNLSPNGYTLKMFTHLAGTYSGQGVTPFTSLVPEPNVRRLSYESLLLTARAARSIACIELSIGDQVHPVRLQDGELLIGPKNDRRLVNSEAGLTEWLSSFPIRTAADAYTAARAIAAQRTSARVSMGGKMGIKALGKDDLYNGAMPGVVEEAIFTLEEGKIYVPLGAFGGATRDIAIDLGLMEADRRVPREDQEASYQTALARIVELKNQLQLADNPLLQRVVHSERAEEIAADVVAILRASQQ